MDDFNTGFIYGVSSAVITIFGLGFAAIVWYFDKKKG